MISEVEQNLLFGVAFITILGTLSVFVWQWWRSRGRD
jgi:hypothetical protein